MSGKWNQKEKLVTAFKCARTGIQYQQYFPNDMPSPKTRKQFAPPCFGGLSLPACFVTSLGLFETCELLKVILE